jgi:hypothetical protein
MNEVGLRIIQTMQRLLAVLVMTVATLAALNGSTAPPPVFPVSGILPIVQYKVEHPDRSRV